MDPVMPRVMPPAVARELQHLMGWRDRPNPIDVYLTIRDVLEAAQCRASATTRARTRLVDRQNFLTRAWGT